MKRIAVVTTSRAEYGLLRRTLEALRAEPCFDVPLIVGGTHLSPAFGRTVQEIEADGVRIDCRVDYLSEDRSPAGIARETGTCATLFADAFAALRPDLLLVLGDRYELLPICTTAFLQGIPIAHIAGGEHTEGALDESVRNAVTMMATLHFPNSPEAAREITRMRGSAQGIFEVGEPCVENSLHTPVPSREALCAALGLESGRRWILATLHPETRKSLAENLQLARDLLRALQELPDCEVILTEANADPGGEQMNALYRRSAGPHLHVFPSLGAARYLGLLEQAWCVVGNSSSGLIETPRIGVPTINIGQRQQGRRLCANVTSCAGNYESIRSALDSVGERFEPDLSLGDGHTSERIVRHIKDYFHES